MLDRIWGAEEHYPENKNASNSRISLLSVTRSYQHKALGELHRQ